MLLLAATAVAPRVAGQRGTVPPPAPVGPPGSPAGQTQPQPSPPLRATGLIIGRVVDAESNQPIAGALVMLAGRNPVPAAPIRLGAAGQYIETAPQPPPQVYTDGQGRFVFRDLVRGSYGVSARASGYLPGSYGQRRLNGPSSQIALDDDGRKIDAVIRIWRQASIGGTVRDEVGEPVVGIQVTLLRSVVMNGRRQLAPAQGVSSDDRGMYRIGGLAPGNYLVFVRNTTSSIPMSTVEDSMKPVTGPAAQAARGEMMRELSMAGVQVGAPGIQVGDQQIHTQGGMYGRSLVGPLPGADARMLVYQTTFYPSATTASQAMSVTLAAGEEKAGIDLQLKLSPAFRVSGRLQGPDGPAANFAVKLQPGNLDEFVTDNGFETSSTVTDAFGQFTFLGVPTGQYTLTALRVPRPAPGPPPPPPVVLSSIGAGVSPPMPQQPVMPTEPTLWARVPVSVGDADLSGLSVLLGVGARVRGRVDFQGASPRPPAQRLQQLNLNLSVADGRSFNVGFTPARPAADGTFTTMSYPPGKYYLSVSSPGPPWWTRSILVGGREAMDTPFDLQSDLSGVVVTFTDQTNELAGTVQRTGAPNEPNPMIVLVPADFQRSLDEGVMPRRFRTAPVSATGQYSFRNLIPGEYLITAVSAEDAGVVGEDLQLFSAFFSAIARVASRVTITDGGKQTLSLSVRPIR
jgi:hypothetical protein